MSRTYRVNYLKLRGRDWENSPHKVRDGYPTHYSKGCEHHGDCDWCKGNRTHKNERRKPIIDWSELDDS